MRKALVVAVLVHGAVAWSLRPPRPPPRAAVAVSSLEVDAPALEAAPEAPPREEQAPIPPTPAPAPGALAGASALRGAAVEERAAGEGTTTALAGAEALAPPGSPAGASDAGDLSDLLRPRLSLEALGAAGTSRSWSLQRPTEESAQAEAKARLEQGVRQELYEADRRTGLGVGGPFVRALEEGTQGEGPARGSATFVITTDGSGRVTDVSVVSASADRPAWAHVASASRPRSPRPVGGSVTAAAVL